MPVANARRPVYGNVLIAGGLALLALGAGNWIVGAIRAEPYAEAIVPEPPSAPHGRTGKERLLDPIGEGEESLRIDRAKHEFYQLVRSSGRVMMVLGAGCVLGGMVGRRWSASRVARTVIAGAG